MYSAAGGCWYGRVIAMTQREFSRRVKDYDQRKHGKPEDYLWRLMEEHRMELLLWVYGCRN